MREIKFRAWNAEDERMIEWHDNFFCDTSEVTRYSGDFSYIDMPLMQYTGFNENSGAEIYEDGIVDVRDEGYPFVKNWKGIVKMVNGCYMIVNFEGTDGEPLFNDSTEIEIIGNIYENQDLIKR